MEEKKAIEVLEKHQKWRLGDIDDMPYNPKEITEAINIVFRIVKSNPQCNNIQK